MKKLTKGFILIDDYAKDCPKCKTELLEIEVPIEEVPKEVVLHALGWCDFRTLQCPSCNQKMVQYKEYDNRYD